MTEQTMKLSDVLAQSGYDIKMTFEMTRNLLFALRAADTVPAEAYKQHFEIMVTAEFSAGLDRMAERVDRYMTTMCRKDSEVELFADVHKSAEQMYNEDFWRIEK